MKHIFKPFFVFLLLLSVGISSAQTQIPSQLHGYWQFKVDSKGGWDGMHVGKNYVEFVYDLASVDSIRQSENEYTLYLNHKRGGHFALSITLQANDSAVFSIPKAKKALNCKRYDRNPDIDYLPVREYSKIINGKRIAVDNSREFIAIKDGKLAYDGKRWNIVWLGEYMKREYRALIENKGEFRLIYLNKQEDNSIKLTFCSESNIYTPITANLGKYAIMGNWYEPVKNEWTYGFFEKFAIYQGKFWDYKTLDIKKNKGTATLQNGNETIELRFNKTNDSTLQIASGKQKAISYNKAERTLPHYKTADTTRFADNHFARVDTAYITGYLRNRKSDKPFEISLHDMITDEQLSYYGDVDSLGRFQMKVPLYNSTMVFLDWKVMHQYDVLEPNEHYFLFYDGSSKQTLFMGKNARIHNEFAAFDFFGIPRYSRQTGVKPLDFLASKREENKKANDYTNNILAQMPNPSEKLRYFLANNNKYDLASDLMQYRFQLNRQNNERFPEDYTEFVRDTLLPNPPSPITLNSQFFTFTRDYVGYSKDQNGSPSLNSNEVILSMAKNNKLILDKADRDLVEMIAGYWTDVMNKKDTVELKKMAGKISAKDSEKFNEIYKQNIEQINSEMSRMFSEMSLKSEFEGMNAVISDRNIRDYYVAGLLYRKLNDDRKPIENELFGKMINRIETPIFRDKVIATQKFYTELSGKSLNYTESLKNTSHLKEAKDADALWKELIAPYKGKIIYVDFWGTWCGPCKMQMAYVADIKKQFAGKDIIFMYFANNSPEESWKNVIKSYSLTGENVVQYRLPDEQQGMLERRFGVKHFPTYMMVDRNGNVVDTNPPIPSQKETTVDYLKGWLEK